MNEEELRAFCLVEHPRLVGAVAMYTGDLQLAEDCAQEALARVVADWPRLRGMSRPGAYVHRIAMNLANGHFRRLGARRRALRRLGGGMAEAVAVSADPADVLAVRAAVAALPRARRAVVVLRYQAGLSHAEIAEVLGISVGRPARSCTVRSRRCASSCWRRRVSMSDSMPHSTSDLLEERLAAATPRSRRPLDVEATLAAGRRLRRRRTLRRSSLATGGALEVLAVVAQLGGWSLPGERVDPAAQGLELADLPVADADGWLPVPDVGEAVPVFLADRTPVFVSHPADGEVLVLDAVSPHRTATGDAKLVAFCLPRQELRDVLHGSLFDLWGDWHGGPAPTGLPAYPSELDPVGARVRVVGDLRAAPGRDEPRGPGREQPLTGERCEPDGTATVVSHYVARHRLDGEVGVDPDRMRRAAAPQPVGAGAPLTLAFPPEETRGADFSFERLTQAGWSWEWLVVSDPDGSNLHVWSAEEVVRRDLATIAMGFRGATHRLVVPEDAIAGQYRVCTYPLSPRWCSDLFFVVEPAPGTGDAN